MVSTGVTVLTALLLTSCSDGAPSGQGPATASPRTGDTVTVPDVRSSLTDEQVRAVLREMDDALGQGDVAAYLQHVDPSLEPAQRAWFAAVHAVPMDVRQIRLDSVVSRNGSEGTVAHVGLRHQITGGDPEPLLEQYRWVFAQDGDGPVRLVASTGRNGALFGHPQVWDSGEPVAVLEGEHVLVLAPEGSRAEAELLLDTLDLAAGRSLETLTFLARGREVLVVHLVGAELLEEATGVAGSPTGEQLLKVSPDEIPWDSPRLTGTDTPVASRLLLDVDLAVDGLSELGASPGGHTSLRYVAAASALWGDDVNLWPQGWVVEGVSNWWSAAEDPHFLDSLRIQVGEHHRGSGRPAALPLVPDLSDPDSLDAFTLESVSLALHVADVHGQSALIDLAGRLVLLDSRYDEKGIESAYVDVLGLGQDELLQQWAAWSGQLAESVDGSLPPPTV